MPSAGLEHEVAEGVHTGHDMVFLATAFAAKGSKKGLKSRIVGLGLKIQGLRFRIEGLGLKITASGLFELGKVRDVGVQGF